MTCRWNHSHFRATQCSAWGSPIAPHFSNRASSQQATVLGVFLLYARVSHAKQPAAVTYEFILCGMFTEGPSPPLITAALPRPPNATGPPGSQSPDDPRLVPLSGSPTFLQPSADKGPVWLPSASDFSTAFATAGQICAAWGGTTADILNQSFQAALVANFNVTSTVSQGRKS